MKCWLLISLRSVQVWLIHYSILQICVKGKATSLVSLLKKESRNKAQPSMECPCCSIWQIMWCLWTRENQLMDYSMNQRLSMNHSFVYHKWIGSIILNVLSNRTLQSTIGTRHPYTSISLLPYRMLQVLLWVIINRSVFGWSLFWMEFRNRILSMQIMLFLQRTSRINI